MKRLIAVMMVLGFVGTAIAQTPKKTEKKAPKKATKSVSTAPVAPAPAAPPKPQFMQIRYFAELLGSSIDKLEDNQIWTGTGEIRGTRKAPRQSDPLNLFNQFSFRFLVGENTRLYVEPRFFLQFGDRNDLVNDAKADGSSVDAQVIQQLDHRIGFMSNYWTSADKKWSTTYRLGTRLPTDRASKNSNIVLQPEALHITNFTPNTKWSFGLWNQLRYYWYEEQVDNERWRLYTGPSMTYTINDIWSIFVMYEHELQHSAPEGKRHFLYGQESLQDVYAGVNYNINPSFTVYPFIRFSQVSRVDPETMQWGLWLMAALY